MFSFRRVAGQTDTGPGGLLPRVEPVRQFSGSATTHIRKDGVCHHHIIKVVDSKCLLFVKSKICKAFQRYNISIVIIVTLNTELHHCNSILSKHNVICSQACMHYIKHYSETLKKPIIMSVITCSLT